MAVQDAATLKGYFNTGDTPTEAQFVDLVDSALEPSGTSIPVQATAPDNPSDGDLWVDSDATPSGGDADPLFLGKFTLGSAASVFTISDLDGAAHGGYRFEMQIYQSSATSSNRIIYINGNSSSSSWLTTYNYAGTATYTNNILPASNMYGPFITGDIMARSGGDDVWGINISGTIGNYSSGFATQMAGQATGNLTSLSFADTSVNLGGSTWIKIWRKL